MLRVEVQTTSGRAGHFRTMDTEEPAQIGQGVALDADGSVHGQLRVFGQSAAGARQHAPTTCIEQHGFAYPVPVPWHGVGGMCEQSVEATARSHGGGGSPIQDSCINTRDSTDKGYTVVVPRSKGLRSSATLHVTTLLRFELRCRIQ